MGRLFRAHKCVHKPACSIDQTKERVSPPLQGVGPFRSPMCVLFFGRAACIGGKNGQWSSVAAMIVPSVDREYFLNQLIMYNCVRMKFDGFWRSVP